MELEELSGEIASLPNRSFYPSAFGAHPSRSSTAAAVYSLSECPSSLSPECLTPYVPFPNTATAANSQVTFGCRFASSCYSCKAPPNSVYQQNVVNHSVNGNVNGHPADEQDVVSLLRCGDVPNRIREFGYTSPYRRIPGYIDVPVVQRARARDHRRDCSFGAEGYQPWNWSNSWSSQVYCPKDQTQSSHIWKSSLTEDSMLSRPDTNPFLQRARKKRVPYSKLQLKELEHEYTITKFITKERRRRIASSTNLTERQVTIWFQNRRVKDKKIISKISKDFGPYK
ncbi:homeobox protein Hox-D13a [Electrophorus electricus]|uniref:homeobox protein Hox-D13a n=1 Tax=Electrophorus electricus TaxID=8005 RepID=UPI0015CFBE13|nr:homeobox protein Hox-D13a [Electrophorus electricus]